MATSLGRSFNQFEGWMKTITGLRFRGIIMPAPETVSPGQIIENRLLLKTRPKEPVAEGMLITDPSGRPFLLGRDDTQLSESNTVAKTFRLFRMTGQYSWKRVTQETDVITGLAKRSGEQELGPIWCAIEQLSSLEIDRGTYMKSEKRRVISGSAIQLQDTIDTLIIRRVSPTFGVYICESE